MDDEKADAVLKPLTITDLKFLKRGAEGAVHSGRWCERTVAVKMFDTLYNERSREVEHLLTLRHRNLVQLLDVGLVNASHAIVMEFCKKGSLADNVRGEHNLSWNFWIKWARQVADGMYYLHRNKVIHRDLKPDNILVTEDNEIRISDFGVSKKLTVTKSTIMSSVGTRLYMAPELIIGNPYSPKVDVWSFGVVLWEMVAGCIPYNGIASIPIIYNIGLNKIRLKLPSVLPPELSALLLSCWAGDHHERPTFSRIRDDLDDIYANCRISEISWAECARQFRDDVTVGAFIWITSDVKPIAQSGIFRNSLGGESGEEKKEETAPSEHDNYISEVEVVMESEESERTPTGSVFLTAPLELAPPLLSSDSQANEEQFETVIDSVRVLALKEENERLQKERDDASKLTATQSSQLKALQEKIKQVENSVRERCTRCKSFHPQNTVHCTLTAAVNNNDLPAVRAFLQHPNAAAFLARQDPLDGLTPLQLAAKKGYADIATELLQAGAYTGVLGLHSAIHIACQQTHVAVVRALVEHGTDVNLRNHLLDTPLHVIAEHGEEELGAGEIVKILLEKGAAKGLKNRWKQNALYLARKAGNEEIVTMLS